ncbi:MAG TPA: hypothetical protein VNO52_09755 [Methylomirabilota bacterium]|nr:hypothetical protein [Methylomirabilota bacterium]
MLKPRIGSRLKALLRGLAALVMALALAPAGPAAEKGGAPDPNSPVGTWRWYFTTPGGDEIESSLQIKKEKDGFVGIFTGRNGRETPVRDLVIQDERISFNVVRERDGQPFTTRYEGRWEGTTITGKFESKWANETRSFDWNAKREAPKVRRDGVNGIWKWTVRLGGRDVEMSLKLEQDGEKVTGVMLSRRGDTEIEDGKFKDKELTFTYTREFGGRSMTWHYKGKLEGNKLVGTVEGPGPDGETTTRDWEAVRDDSEKTTAAVGGLWRWTHTAAGGQTFEPQVRLIQTETQLTGTLTWGENQVPISSGRVEGSNVTFQVIRERDGETFTNTYSGLAEGDILRGRVASNWGGVDKVIDWQARRISRRQ